MKSGSIKVPVINKSINSDLQLSDESLFSYVLIDNGGFSLIERVGMGLKVIDFSERINNINHNLTFEDLQKIKKNPSLFFGNRKITLEELFLKGEKHSTSISINLRFFPFSNEILISKDSTTEELTIIDSSEYQTNKSNGKILTNEDIGVVSIIYTNTPVKIIKKGEILDFNFEKDAIQTIEI